MPSTTAGSSSARPPTTTTSARPRPPAAQALLAGCTECAALAADITTIAHATAVSVVPARPRDFRLTPTQAERAGGGVLDRLGRWLSTPRGTVVRPLAAASLAIGIVLVAVGPSIKGPLQPPAPTPNAEIAAPGATATARPDAHDADGRRPRRPTAAPGRRATPSWHPTARPRRPPPWRAPDRIPGSCHRPWPRRPRTRGSRMSRASPARRRTGRRWPGCRRNEHHPDHRRHDLGADARGHRARGHGPAGAAAHLARSPHEQDPLLPADRLGRRNLTGSGQPGGTLGPCPGSC